MSNNETKARLFDKACEQFVRKLDDPDWWVSSAGAVAEYLRDNPDEIERIRAEVEAANKEDAVDSDDAQIGEYEGLLIDMHPHLLRCLPDGDRGEYATVELAEAIESHVSSLRSQLAEAAIWFHEYGDMHMAKNKVEKATANYERRNKITAVLAGEPFAEKQEPEHAFPEDDDDLVGEMFECRRGGTWTVLDYSRLPPRNGVRSYVCQCDGGRLREMWEPDTIRDRTPLGPSPAKRELQALKRVAEAAKAYRKGVGYANLQPLSDELDKLEEANE